MKIIQTARLTSTRGQFRSNSTAVRSQACTCINAGTWKENCMNRWKSFYLYGKIRRQIHLAKENLSFIYFLQFPFYYFLSTDRVYDRGESMFAAMVGVVLRIVKELPQLGNFLVLGGAQRAKTVKRLFQKFSFGWTGKLEVFSWPARGTAWSARVGVVFIMFPADGGV